MKSYNDNIKITAMDNDLLSKSPQIVALLQKAYNNEYLAWFTYEHASHFIFGPWRETIIDHFESHAAEEEKHANWVGNRLTALGEAPALDMKVIKRASTLPENDYVKLLEFIMQLEGEAVSLYSSMLPLLDGHAAMRNTIEGYIETEQEHFEDFEKMVRIVPEIEGSHEEHEEHDEPEETEKPAPQPEKPTKKAPQAPKEDLAEPALPPK